MLLHPNTASNSLSTLGAGDKKGALELQTSLISPTSVEDVTRFRHLHRGSPQADYPPGIMVVDLGDVVLTAGSTAVLDVIYTGVRRPTPTLSLILSLSLHPATEICCIYACLVTV